MTGVFGEKVFLGQASGPDVELIVRGSELYASYETPDGYPAVYDDAHGLFCYAELVSGEFRSTGVPVTDAAPAQAEPHVREADAVRTRKIEARKRTFQARARSKPEEEF